MSAAVNVFLASLGIITFLLGIGGLLGRANSYSHNSIEGFIIVVYFACSALCFGLLMIIYRLFQIQGMMEDGDEEEFEF